eukprot:13917941-Ditylum_brightwellii.AAC.1
MAKEHVLNFKAHLAHGTSNEDSDDDIINSQEYLIKDLLDTDLNIERLTKMKEKKDRQIDNL